MKTDGGNLCPPLGDLDSMATYLLTSTRVQRCKVIKLMSSGIVKLKETIFYFVISLSAAESDLIYYYVTKCHVTLCETVFSFPNLLTASNFCMKFPPHEWLEFLFSEGRIQNFWSECRFEELHDLFSRKCHHVFKMGFVVSLFNIVGRKMVS